MRKLISLLILLSIIPAITATVAGQSYSTVTSILTTVNQLSYTNTISAPVQTLTYTTSGSQTLVDTSYATVAQNQGFCQVQYINFQAQGGERVTGTITSSAPNSLIAYILTDQDFHTWGNASPSYCNPSDNSVTPQWTSSSDQLTSATVDWTPKVDGKYWLASEVYSNAGTVTVTINLSSPFVQTVTSEQFSTSTVNSVIATTQTLTSIQVQSQQPQATTSTGSTSDLMLPVAGVAAVIIVIVAVALVMLKRKAKPQ